MKSKFLKKGLTFLLVVCSAFATFAGCGKTGGEESETPVVEEPPIASTGKYIVKDGATEYKLVVEESPSEKEFYAQSEFIDLFAQATGITLEVVSDQTPNLTTDGKYFSIGDNAFFQSTGVKIPFETYGEDGIRLFTKGNSVFMCGGGGDGTIYSVYEFLEHAFNFDVYGVDGTYIDTNVKELPLYAYDQSYIPSFEKRSIGSGLLYEAPNVERRMKIASSGTYIGSVDGTQSHTSLKFLPPDIFAKEHGAWYSASLGELCYTAHGIEAEFEKMTQAAADKAIESIKVMTQDSLTLTQQDNTVFCGCDKCRELERTYGCKSAAIVKFVNAVHRKIMKWFATEEGQEYKRDFKLYFFAYQSSLEAPVKLNANGEYEPIDQTVVCDDGVAVYFAPMEYDYENSIEHEINTKFREAFKGWKVLSKEMIMWCYNTNFNYYLAPYDSFEYMKEFLMVAKDTGISRVYHQQQNNQIGSTTGWHNLKIYLAAKLMWDLNEDVGALTEKFFKGYYGPVSEDMLRLYTQYRVHSKVARAKLPAGTSSVYKNILRTEYWQRELVLSWSKSIQEIVQKLEPLKMQDEAEYKRIYKNVVAEGVSIEYILIEVYGNTFAQSELNEIKNRFKNYLKVAGIGKLDLLTQISDYVESLGK